VGMINSSLMEAINSTYISYNVNYQFWSRFSVPSLLEVFDLLRPYMRDIHVDRIAPYYREKPFNRRKHFYIMPLEKTDVNCHAFEMESLRRFPGRCRFLRMLLTIYKVAQVEWGSTAETV